MTMKVKAIEKKPLPGPSSPSAGLPLNSLFAQKSIIICSARMRCKDNEIMHCKCRIKCLTLSPKGCDYDL